MLSSPSLRAPSEEVAYELTGTSEGVRVRIGVEGAAKYFASVDEAVVDLVVPLRAGDLFSSTEEDGKLLELAIVSSDGVDSTWRLSLIVGLCVGVRRGGSSMEEVADGGPRSAVLRDGDRYVSESSLRQDGGRRRGVCHIADCSG